MMKHSYLFFWGGGGGGGGLKIIKVQGCFAKNKFLILA